ncbi:RNA-directed DNA polymerase, eukaryota, reverse transcriptase zinc-binding domain protein [Tanacetum coccineum]
MYPTNTASSSHLLEFRSFVHLGIASKCFTMLLVDRLAADTVHHIVSYIVLSRIRSQLFTVFLVVLVEVAATLKFALAAFDGRMVERENLSPQQPPRTQDCRYLGAISDVKDIIDAGYFVMENLTRVTIAANIRGMLARPEHNGLKSVYCFFKQFLWMGKSVPRIIYDRIIKSHSEPILSVKVEIGRDDDNFLLTMHGLPKPISWLGSHIKSLIAAMYNENNEGLQQLLELRNYTNNDVLLLHPEDEDVISVAAFVASWITVGLKGQGADHKKVANLPRPNSGDSGSSNSYVNAVKNHNSVDHDFPTIVLDEDCALSKDLSSSLMGRIKEFASLTNLKNALMNEGFVDLNLLVLGNSPSFFRYQPDGRIVWVEIEGVPLKLWTLNTFKRIVTRWGNLIDTNDSDGNCFHSKRLCLFTKSISNIYENFKIIFRGKVYWIRAKEVPGWTPDLVEDSDEEELSDDDSLEEGMKNLESENDCSNSFEVPDTVFENEGGSKKDSSVDPFGLYPLLNKKTKDKKHKESGLAQKAKKDWAKELCVKNKVNFLAIQETKMEEIDLFSVRRCWGNSTFEHLHSNSILIRSRRFSSEAAHDYGRFPFDSFTIGFISRALMISSLQLGILPLLLTLMECVTWRDRFAKPSERRANIDMRFPKTISEDQSQDLEREHDVYMAVNHFFIHGEIPPGCNSSFIALIPKVPDANLVKDFRPISLIGSIYKIIAKILSNRLVNVLGDIVNEVQSAFIAERQMLDGPFILNEILQWCTKKKKKTLIFKVDFEKAFDSIRWDFLDDVLKEFGFRCKWRNWIQSCLTSSKGSILVNGCPTNEFQFYKGLKQGDPLSPFLFILVMESLHLSFQRIVNAGMFKGIVLDQSLCLSHMFYADDAIFLGEWSDGNISTLIHVLKCFFHASGLKINLNKSKIMGINVESAQVIQAAAKLGCLVLKCPFYYLGTRVGGSMTRVQAWQEIVEKVKSRLSKWKSKTLSIGGRLTLLKSVLGSIPVFHMSIFKVPSKVLHILESIRSHFFNGHDPGSKKASWVKWNNVLTDKKRGGLGVSSLFALNRGLMIKWVWKFLSQKDSLWTKVIVAIHGVGGKIHSEWTSTGKSCWLSILSEVRSLQRKGMYVFDYLTHKMGNGESTKFWLDHWHTRGIFKDIFPRLYALESSKDVTVSSKIGDTSLVCSFRRIPRGGIEQNQFDSLVELVRSVTIVPSADRWNWNLESTGIFSVASARRRIDEICLPNIGEETRWVKCVPIKINVLAWKIKTDALPTRFNISRRGIDIQDMSCPICDNAIESTDHLFFRCGLVRDIANKVLSWWNLDHANLNSYAEWKSWLVSIRMDSKLKKMFEGVWYSIWWYVWIYRNKLLFDERKPSKSMLIDNVIASSFYWCKYRSIASFGWNEWLKNLYIIVL